MPLVPGSLKRPLAALSCVALLALPGCQATADGWTFAVSRSAYGGEGGGIDASGLVHCNSGGEGAAIAMVVLLLLPLAIDLVALPVALTHDLCD